MTYQNADSAQNFGMEVDFRKNFGFLGGQLEKFVGWECLLDLFSCRTLRQCRIQTSDARALEGQSPYVYNLQFGYDNPEGKGGVTALYNVFGPRITEVGALGAPDYFEESIHRLDLVSSLQSRRPSHWVQMSESIGLTISSSNWGCDRGRSV